MEFTVPVVGSNHNARALPVIEIIPKKANFFDYNSKYSTGGSDEIVPARLNKKQTKEIQELAVKIHRHIGCKGITRSDFIYSKGKFYFLEINTIPGMTEASLVPKSAKVAGLTFTKLIDLMIAQA